MLGLLASQPVVIALAVVLGVVAVILVVRARTKSRQLRDDSDMIDDGSRDFEELIHRARVNCALAERRAFEDEKREAASPIAAA